MRANSAGGTRRRRIDSLLGAARYQNVLCEVIWHLHAKADLYHGSAFLSGLSCLSLSRRVGLKIELFPPDVSLEGEGCPLHFTLRAVDGKTWRIVIDLYDRSDLFHQPSLRWADVFWKRSYRREDVTRLPLALQARVRPFGLNFATRTDRAATRVMPPVVGSWLWRSFTAPTQMRRELPSTVENWKRFVRLPTHQDYEASPEAHVEQTVLFQPRVWETSEVHPDCAEAINEPRVQLVRELKRAFGPRFRGGLMPTPLAKRCYPELISSFPHHRSDYVQFAKRQLVAVCTRGLHYSTPFKLAEALAASQVMVRTAMRCELPQPLIPEQHYLEFADVDSCLSQCDRVLSSPKLAQELRRASWDYYRRHVRPPEHALQVLKQTLQSSAAAGSSGGASREDTRRSPLQGGGPVCGC